MAIQFKVFKRPAFSGDTEELKKKAAQYGLSVSDVATSVHAQMRGLRATLFHTESREVETIARLADGTSVAARQDKLLACAFHPELTDDLRFHRYFLDIVAGHL